ncbi:MAG: hypothetical protein ACK5MN_00515 [Lachnospiraceae bacterium]
MAEELPTEEPVTEAVAPEQEPTVPIEEVTEEEVKEAPTGFI